MVFWVPDEGCIPKVEAPDGTGWARAWVAGCEVLGCVPEVDGVRDECGKLEEDDPLDGEDCGACGAGCAGAGAAWVGTDIAHSRNVGQGTVVLLKQNSGTVSGSPVRNL